MFLFGVMIDWKIMDLNGDGCAGKNCSVEDRK